MKYLTPILILICLFVATLISPRPSLAVQKKGYRHHEVRKVSFDAPDDMRISQGTVVGHFTGSGGPVPPFPLSTLTAVHPRERFFANAGYGEPTWTFASNEALEKDAENVLGELLSVLDIPLIGRLNCEADSTSVSKYESARAPFRETTCTLQGTDDEYRIYVLLKLKHRKLNNALQVFYFVVGCPEERVSDFDLVMSTMIASLKFS